MARVPVYSRSGDTSPIVGQLPTWKSAWKTSDWTAFGSPPAFDELSRGWYFFEVPATSFVGVIDFGSGSKPQYAVYYPHGFGIAMALDKDGEPLEGLNPTWHRWYLDIVTEDLNGAPSIIEVGGGLYRFDVTGASDNSVGSIDFGDTALERYVPWTGAGQAGSDVTPPEIGNFNIDPGSSKIDQYQHLEFDITDNGTMVAIALFAQFPDGTADTIYDGDEFVGEYTDPPNERNAIAGGYRYTILRRGGWPGNPTIKPLVLDAGANIGVKA